MTGAGVQQAKSVPQVGSHMGLDELDYPESSDGLWQIAQCGAGNAAGNTGPALAHAVVGNERMYHISPTRWG